MTKFFIILALALYSLTTLAQRDSVAFFYNHKKINVLINERGMNSRLHDFMNQFGAEGDLLLTSSDQDINLGCAREIDRVSCTFTFFPSSDVHFVDRELQVHKSLKTFGLAQENYFEMSFRSSMKDNIHLIIEDGILKITASKK